MALRYTPEELLRLRQSPLCVKPKDLPPLEEWIGQAVDEKTKRPQTNGRATREGQAQGNGTAKIPSALDFSGRQHGRQTSNGEFAKSGMFSPSIRDANNSFDSTSRMSLGPLSPRGERSSGMGRFGASDREQDATRERATTRFSALRASKDEGDSWLTTKITRKQDGEEGDRTFNRRNDREYENGRDNGRENHRRYGSDAVTENIRNRDWRQADKTGARLANRDWNNGLEQDPEWMAEEKPPAEDKKKTVEDFEAWKRSMRAQDAAAKGDTSQLVAEVEDLHTQPVPKKLVDTRLALEGGEDKFFGFFGAPKPAEPTHAALQINQQPADTIKAGKSKFGKFFAAPEPQPQLQLQPQPQHVIPQITQQKAAPTPPPSGHGHKAPAAEDEQGFQRILNMLKAKSPAAPQGNVPFQAPPQRHRTPPQEAISTSATPPLVSPRPKSNGVQQFLNPQSPSANPDSQFLLQLMRAKDPESMQLRQQPQQYGGQSGRQQQPVHDQPPPYLQQQFERSNEDRHPVEFPPGFDKLNPSTHHLNQRRHGRLDSRNFDDIPNQYPQQHGIPPGFPGFLPGINSAQFPPGLGPMHNQQASGYPGPRGPIGAPPGFGGPGPGAPGPFRGGMALPPGFNGMPNIGGMHLGDDRDRDHGPGLGPPPGFAGGPPGMSSRLPPGFAGRGGPIGMPMGDMFDQRRGEQGVYGSNREQ